MNKKFWTILILAILAPAVIIGYNSCGVPVQYSKVQNTSTAGNPMAPISDQLMFAICGVINRCNQNVTIESCQNNLLSTSGMNNPLVLPTNYSTLSSIMAAEQAGSLVGDSTVANSCYTAINNLDCANPAVQAAYNPSATNPLSNVPAMIPSQSCSQSFVTPGILYCPTAPQPTFTVDDLGDAGDATSGDHICATASGTCTLRAALMEANADGPGTYTIAVPAGTIPVGSSLPINNNIQIFGSCAGSTIIDGQSKTNIFAVGAANIQVTMHALQLQNASAGSGGAVDDGWNSGVTFDGSLLTFLSNSSSSATNGGGAVKWGAAGTTFKCIDCIFNANQSTSTGEGGALYLGGSGNLIERSLFTNNIASADGGGVFDASSGSTYINNTFSGNNNGAIYLQGASTFVLINNTVVGNISSGGSSGALSANSATVQIQVANNLFFNNTGGNCDGLIPLSSLGGNLDYPKSGCNFNQPSDIFVAPTLGPLQNNGGFSSTFALLPGSAGIDQGVTSQCPAVDQRNDLRLTDGKCDIGAFESAP